MTPAPPTPASDLVARPDPDLMNALWRAIDSLAVQSIKACFDVPMMRPMSERLAEVLAPVVRRACATALREAHEGRERAERERDSAHRQYNDLYSGEMADLVAEVERQKDKAILARMEAATKAEDIYILAVTRANAAEARIAALEAEKAGLRTSELRAAQAACEAVIPLEALNLVGLEGRFSAAVIDGIRNGITKVREMVRARAATALAGTSTTDAGGGE